MIKIRQPYAFREIGHKENQEDYFAPCQLDATTRCFVVCDGVGGLACGEVASKVFAENVVAEYEKRKCNGRKVDSDLLRRVIERAWEALDKVAAENKKRSKMATTLALVIIDDETETAWIAHIGDSRVYVVRPKEKRITFVTKDHSIVEDLKDMGQLNEEQAKTHPLAHVITKAVIPGEKTEPTIETVKLRPGDYILLCSDGVMERVSERDILAILTGKDNDEQKMNMMKQYSHNSADNNTAVLIPVMGTGSDRSWIKWLVGLILATLFFLLISTQYAQAQDRQRVGALIMATNTLLRQKDYAGAAEKLEEITRVMPNLDWPYLRLANIYRRKGDTYNKEKAIACYEKYMERCKKPNVVDSIGRITAGMKQSNVVLQQQQTSTVSQQRINAVPQQQSNAADIMSEMASAPQTTQPIVPVAQPETIKPVPSNQPNVQTESAEDILGAMFGESNEAPKVKPTVKPTAPLHASSEIGMVEIDVNKPLLTYRPPYDVLKEDVINSKAQLADGVSPLYVSAMFNHFTGRDALAFTINDAKQVCVSPESDIEKAYEAIIGFEKQNVSHGVTDATAFDGAAWKIKLEYNFDDDVCKKPKWRDIVDKMIGSYFNQSPVTEQLMQSEMDYIDKANKGVLKVVYDFDLTPVNGILYGTGTIKASKKLRVIKTQERSVARPPLYVSREVEVEQQVGKRNRFIKKIETVIDTIPQADTIVVDTLMNKDVEYQLASVTSTQVFAPMSPTYTVADLAPATPEENLNLEPLYKEYDIFCNWHKQAVEENYSGTDIFNKLSQLSRLYQPEAVYTVYAGYLIGAWSLPRNTRIARTYKNRMMRIQNYLKQ